MAPPRGLHKLTCVSHLRTVVQILLNRADAGDSQVETRSLLYFIAVAEEKNIGRAASRLHITQPALTRQVQSLEQEVGVPLFTRTATGMEITTAGTTLLQHARAIRAELGRAKTNVLHAGTQCRTQVDVGVYGSAILTIVPQLLSAFAATQPAIEFRLHNVRKDQQIEFLRTGKTLLAIDRYLPQEEDMAYEVVFREYMQVAVHKDHPLARKEIIDVSMLEDEPRIGANFDTGIELGLGQVYGVKSRACHRADDVLTSLALVSAGLAVTFAPASIEAVGIPNVVFRPYTGLPKVPMDVQCMYRRDDPSPVLHAFLDVVRAYRADQREQEAA
jgi:LysR family transcriptional regulator, benzoate and cis,cis-muconate-responsive activator of ben and cat genes